MQTATLYIENPRQGNFFRWLFRYLCYCVVVVVSLLLYSAFGIYVYLVRTMPETPNLAKYDRFAPMVTSILAADGTLIAQVGKEHREFVLPQDLPAPLVQAVLATEDRRFYSHHGIDFWGLGRALYEDIKTGKLAQGGSTITQQVAKAALFSEKSFVRKFREMILARNLECRYSKEDILAVYLNQVPFGHIKEKGISVFGIQAAAHLFFNNDVKNLQLNQMALLAGMIQAPTRYSPFGDTPEKAEKRKNQVLQNMVEAGYLSSQAAEFWKQQPMALNPSRDIFKENSPYFVDHVKSLTKSIFKQQFPTLPDPFETGGYRIETTVMPYADVLAADNVNHAARTLDKRQGFRGVLDHISKSFSAPGTNHPPTPWEKMRSTLAHLYPDLSDPDRIRIGLVDQAEEKGAWVWVGSQRFLLPIANMKWAHRFSKTDAVNDQTISSVKQALRVGDLIWVRFQPNHKPKRFSEYIATSQKQPNGFVTTDMAWVHPDSVSVPTTRLLLLEQEPRPQAALLTFDLHTGYVFSMAGGNDYQRSQFNRVLHSCRQPGSAYKPIYYSLALEKGYNYDSIWHDKIKQEIDPVTGLASTPKNIDEKYENWVTLERALTWSKNPPALEIFKTLGAKEVEKWARQLGFTTPIHADDALALGASCVTIDEISSVFALFARNGTPVPLVYIKRIQDREGNTLYNQAHWSDPEIDPRDRLAQMVVHAGIALKPRIPPRTAWLTDRLLRKVVSEGHSAMIRAAQIMAAGKTGTSSRTADAWFIGHTSRLLSTAWVGDDAYERPLGHSDASFTTSVPMWTRYMYPLLATSTDNPPTELPIERPIGVSPNDRGGPLYNEQAQSKSDPANSSADKKKER